MKAELSSAANFLVHLIRLSRSDVTDAQMEKFRASLLEVLQRRYRDHWFPDRPCKGSGYRCLRINGKLDPVLSQAAEATTISPARLHAAFPSELTMWIDPREVCYRIGENGSICMLYDGSASKHQEPWKPSGSSHMEKVTPSSETHANSNSESSRGKCNYSMRRMDLILDPRQSATLEPQLAAYV